MTDTLQTKIDRLCTLVESQQSRLQDLRVERLREQTKQAKAILAKAVEGGKLAPLDAKAQDFWLRTIVQDPEAAGKALEALPSNPVLAKVTEGGDDPKFGLLDKMALQKKKLAEVQATNPQADFPSIFAKAQSEAPDLFR